MEPNELDPLFLLHNDPDWINSEKFNFSLDSLTATYPDGVPDRLLASCLMINRDETEAIYNDILLQLREIMGVSVEEEPESAFESELNNGY